MLLKNLDVFCCHLICCFIGWVVDVSKLIGGSFFYSGIEFVEDNREKLAQRCLDSALDGETFRVEDLKATDYYQVYEFFGKLHLFGVQESEDHLKDSNLSHFIDTLTTGIFQHAKHHKENTRLKINHD